VNSQQLVKDAKEAVNERAFVCKKARRAETSLTLALIAEKDRVKSLEQSLGQTLAEKLVIIQEHKKGTLTLALTLTLTLTQTQTQTLTLTLTIPLHLIITIETRQYDVDAQQLVRDANEANDELASVVKKATRTQACLTRALIVEKERVDKLETACEQRQIELDFVERNGAKERRQLEIDKASLADQITVSRNKEARLNTRANDLRNQRVSLKQFRMQGQINIDKAVVEQIAAVKSDTKVV
jgi:hypothetical protein